MPIDMKRNLTMLTDFYEITMSNGYLEYGLEERTAVFDMFFRKIPDDGGFAIFAGLEQLIEYIKDLEFTEEDIEFLRGKGQFSEAFLDYLQQFPVLLRRLGRCGRARRCSPTSRSWWCAGPVIQAQLIETMVLLTINHQSLVATKANRIVPRRPRARPVIRIRLPPRPELRRGRSWARAPTYIGGCSATACAIADRRLRHARAGHHGPQLGAGVRQRVRGLQKLRAGLPRTTASCWWTPTTSLKIAACPTPSAFLTRC